jgi:hypothetical protein
MKTTRKELMSTLANWSMERDLAISVAAVSACFYFSRWLAILILIYRIKIVYYRYQAINHNLVTAQESLIWEIMWMGITGVVCAWLPLYVSIPLVAYRGYMLFKVIQRRAKWGSI